MSVSIRETLERHYSVDLSRGIRGSVLSLKQLYRSAPESFPYESVRALLRSVEWPSGLSERRAYPRDREHGWSVELQGVTNDGANWFFTQKGTLWKFPLGHDLGENVSGPDRGRGILMTGIPHDGYNHFGDLDYRDGKLYVALEDLEDRDTPLVCVFDADTLHHLWSGKLTQQGGGAPWCAINPFNGLLYSSKFDDTHLRVYEPSRPTTSMEQIPYRGRFRLEKEVNNIQGGVFSDNGHLYLVSDTEDDGIYGFDMVTGEIKFHRNIDYDSTIWLPPPVGSKRNEELEGITILDLEQGQSPGVERSQIHVVMLDNDPDTDDFYIRHYKAKNNEKHKI